MIHPVPINRPKTSSLVRDQRGSDFVEMIIIIGLFCLAVGVAMALVGDTIFSEMDESADHVEETSDET